MVSGYSSGCSYHATGGGEQRATRDDADVIGDGRVTALDALAILQAVSYHNPTASMFPSNHTYGVV